MKSDIFLKIKTSDGKTGWVPQSAIAVYEKTIIEKTIHNRFCFQPDEPLCGFDKHLSGKVLYYTVAKDILYSLVYDKFEVIDVRIKNFIERNIDHREYNDIIKEAYNLAVTDRSKGINHLNIPPRCEIVTKAGAAVGTLTRCASLSHPLTPEFTRSWSRSTGTTCRLLQRGARSGKPPGRWD